MRRYRRGVTIIELLAVLAIISILIRFSIPRLWEIRRRATAASVLGDMHAIRLAAINNYQDVDAWPPDYAAGSTPLELVKYLPGGFSFTRPGYQLDFERWTVGSTTVIGIGLLSADTNLGPTVERMLGPGMVALSPGGSQTFLLLGLGGTF